MISSIFYNGDGSTRIFPVTFKINGEDYVRVYVDNVEVIDRTKYDIINNSIVFAPGDIPAVGTDNIKIYVATSSSELGDLGAPLTDITNVANNLAEIVAVSTQVIPNLPEILLADNNATIATNQATIATTKASEASASASSASNSATTAITKASEANASAISASNSATSASNSANTATTKANEASASASLASASANNASTSETMAYKWSSNPVDTIVETDKYSALHWATKAQQWASTVDTTNFVDRTTNQTISGTKTFSNTIIGNISGTSTKLNNSATDYLASGAIESVVGMLAWKNFGNRHVIFDASNGTAPNWTAVNNTNSAVPWEPGLPSLMGWNGSQTFGVRVDSSRVAEYASNAIGYNQTYQNVTSSRVAGTTYANSTGRPIQVLVRGFAVTNTGTVYLYINSVLICSNSMNPGWTGTATAIVQNGETYKVIVDGGVSISTWFELR